MMRYRAKLSLSAHSIVSIATGEGVARFCNLLLIVYISRKFGIKALGGYALAQALSLYLSQGIDLGLRHIGASSISSHIENTNSVIHEVQRKRLVLSVPVIALGYCYGHYGPIPDDSRSLVSLYALSMIGYAFSVDWFAWGMKCFHWMSGWRALVSGTGLLVTIVFVEAINTNLRAVALGNGLGYIVASYVLWHFWARPVLSSDAIKPSSRFKKNSTIGWKPVLWMGLAMLANQAFSSIDILILGALSNSVEVGLYSAAYRIFLLILAIYYLVMQTLYPQLASIPPGQRHFRALQPYLKHVTLLGVGVAILLECFREPIISLIYGPAFAYASTLLTPILWSIPLELVSSFVLTANIAWGRSRIALFATMSAGVASALMNLFLIPRYGALGAAYATPLSFCIFLLVLLLSMNWSLSNIRAHAQTDSLHHA